MAEKTAKKGAGLVIEAVGIVLAVVATVVMAYSNSISSDYALASFGTYIAFAVVGIALACVAIWADLADVARGLVTMLCLGVAVFLLTYAGIQVVGERIIAISSLFSWNSANATGWTVFYSTVATLVLYLVSSVVLVIGSFLPIAKK